MKLIAAQRVIWIRAAGALLATLLLLAGCGGGSSSTPAAPTNLVLNGTAAKGLALTGATVAVKCASGTGTATTAMDGSYSVSITSGSLPCAIEVTGSGGSPVYHSAVAGTGAGPFTVNASPLTELVMAQVAGSAGTTTAALFSGFATKSSAVTTTSLAAGVSYLQTALKGIVDLTGVNPLSDTLVAANGSTAGNALDTKISTLTTQIAAAQTTLSAVVAAVVGNPTTPAALTQALKTTTAASPFTALTATMTTAREGHSATLLPNGKVLLAGGLFSSVAASVNTAEAYDPVTQTFIALTTTMTSARSNHQATLLPNENVLITGGQLDIGGNGLNTAEVYDSVTGAFTALPATMSTPRGGHSATLLPSGKVLLAGGFSNGSALNTAELYDPVANTFTALTAVMSTPRANHTATLLPNGQVLLTGGGGSSGPQSNTAEVYDPVANTFTALASTMTIARVLHGATLLPNGQVLLTGGLNGPFSVSSGNTLNTAELYDPVARTFTALAATMTTPRGGHTATLLPDGQVLIAGGVSSSAGASPTLSTAEVYEALSPAVQTFTALTATMTTARVFHTATRLPNGQVLVAGGINTRSFPAAALNTAEVYDPVANTFTAITATMTTPRDGHTATLLANGNVLITGGQNIDNGNGLNTAEVYDPVAQTFTALTAKMTTPRGNHTSTLQADGRVLFTGGFNNGPSLNTAEMYDPVANTFTALTPSMTTLRSGHTATRLPNGQVLITGGNVSTIPEVYDPVANTFTALTAAMTTPRGFHTATLLPNGQVLITGGCGSVNNCTPSSFVVVNSAEAYDPVANTFTSLTATMTTPRGGHTATLLANGGVLLTGGAAGSLGVLNTAELYVP